MSAVSHAAEVTNSGRQLRILKNKSLSVPLIGNPLSRKSGKLIEAKIVEDALLIRHRVTSAFLCLECEK